jgi:hypothetical protein
MLYVQFCDFARTDRIPVHDRPSFDCIFIVAPSYAFRYNLEGPSFDHDQMLSRI